LSSKKKKEKKKESKTEGLCKRCGRCCLLKTLDPDTGLLVALDVHCPYFALDNGKGFCKIYDDHVGARLIYKHHRGICLDREKMIVARIMPNDCPYVKNIPGYKTTVINYEEAP
jgi:uncharacterized cysteine cluster protein YcgN (CxxCxxCC family)